MPACARGPHKPDRTMEGTTDHHGRHQTGNPAHHLRPGRRALRPLPPDLPEHLFTDLAALADLGPQARVLEIGCGTGQATVPLAQRGGPVVAMDLSPDMAAIAPLCALGQCPDAGGSTEPPTGSFVGRAGSGTEREPTRADPSLQRAPGHASHRLSQTESSRVGESGAHRAARVEDPVALGRCSAVRRSCCAHRATKMTACCMA